METATTTAAAPVLTTQPAYVLEDVIADATSRGNSCSCTAELWLSLGDDVDGCTVDVSFGGSYEPSNGGSDYSAVLVTDVRPARHYAAAEAWVKAHDYDVREAVLAVL